MIYGSLKWGSLKSLTKKKSSRFRVGDEVYLSTPPNAQGPYLIASVPTIGTYTLCLGRGQLVNGGREVAEKDLIWAL